MSHRIDIIWIHKLILENTVNSVIEQVHISHLPLPFWQSEVGVLPAFLEKRKKITFPGQRRKSSSGQMEKKEKEYNRRTVWMKTFTWASLDQMGRNGSIIHKMDLNSIKSLIHQFQKINFLHTKLESHLSSSESSIISYTCSAGRMENFSLFSLRIPSTWFVEQIIQTLRHLTNLCKGN